MSAADITFHIFNHSLMVILIIATLYPFLNVLAISLNNSVDTGEGRYNDISERIYIT